MCNFSYFKNLRFLGFCLLMGLTISAYSQTTLTQEIDKLLNARCLDKNQTSVSIVALPSATTVYANHTDKPLLPASVMKLVTSAAALHYLGPEYRFKTEFLYRGQRQNGTIQGDLIIRGGGDPRLTTEELWYIASQIKASGIKEITGNLIVDKHFFDDYDRAPQWDTERTQRPYDAKLSAFALNFNSIAIHVLPGQYVGNRLNAWLDPAPAYIYLDNNTKTIKRGRNTISARRSEETDGRVKIRLAGRLPVSAEEKTVRLNVENPFRYAAETFRALLNEVGIKIHGTTKIVSTPLFGTQLYEHYSQNLSLILKELNTYSNNFTAEQIIKTIAAERFGTPGSHAEGLKLIKEFLHISGANTNKVILADGSGLSRNNQMTTAAITDFLKTMYLRFDIGPDFLAALRVMGSNGINSHRLTNSPARGQIRAKTGTLKGVSTLAGYVATERQIFAFALFLNNNRCGYRGADRIEDSIVTAIYNQGY
jgi:D-alanyl-D-alanine carboxypeptidase/D-alanyl-D-alanine-endopeptidase (penicillin-binding protein 4)